MTSEPLTERVPFMAGANLVAVLDAAAKELGISRSELIRRRLDADPFIYEKSRRWQNRSADVAEQRADTQPSEFVPPAVLEKFLKADLEADDLREWLEDEIVPGDFEPAAQRMQAKINETLANQRAAEAGAFAPVRAPEIQAKRIGRLAGVEIFEHPDGIVRF